MVTTCPDISDNWRGSVLQAAKLLGMTRQGLYRYLVEVTHGRRSQTVPGLLPYVITPGTSRKVILGSDLKRFWRNH